jgi:hypothetical protein
MLQEKARSQSHSKKNTWIKPEMDRLEEADQGTLST